jgi:hypothetical protein
MTNRKSKRQEALKQWIAANEVDDIETFPVNRADFMSGFDAGWKAHKDEVQTLIENFEPAKSGDETGHYAQGYIDTRRSILALLESPQSLSTDRGDVTDTDRDIRPALRELERATDELCKCFCHTRDGLTICPDCESVHNSRDYQLRCKTCGTERVYVRGQYPGHDNRLVCPQCVRESLDDLIAVKGSERRSTNAGSLIGDFTRGEHCSICGMPMLDDKNHPLCVAAMSPQEAK